YTVTLITVDGKQPWSRSGLKSRQARSGKAINIRVPVKVLNSGQNVFTVRGVTAEGTAESVESYPFNVVKK
ncbi:MAG: hypothetical protein LC731_08300, partial [Acidobacteria bacterium]|nr:hypothetical protein [Acidobacteriota bacterium]